MDQSEAKENEELLAFENEVDEMLATGAMDDALAIVDEEGVAHVLPVLDTEPISHLLLGIEDIGGKGNVLVRTDDGIAVLNIAEYSPQTDVDKDDEEDASANESTVE